MLNWFFCSSCAPLQVKIRAKYFSPFIRLQSKTHSSLFNYSHFVNVKRRFINGNSFLLLLFYYKRSQAERNAEQTQTRKNKTKKLSLFGYTKCYCCEPTPRRLFFILRTISHVNETFARLDAACNRRIVSAAKKQAAAAMQMCVARARARLPPPSFH